MRVTTPTLPFTQRWSGSLRRNMTCAPGFNSSASSAGKVRPPKSPVTSARAVSTRPGSLASAAALMRETVALVVASVITP